MPCLFGHWLRSILSFWYGGHEVWRKQYPSVGFIPMLVCPFVFSDTYLNVGVRTTVPVFYDYPVTSAFPFLIFSVFAFSSTFRLKYFPVSSPSFPGGCIAAACSTMPLAGVWTWLYWSSPVPYGTFYFRARVSALYQCQMLRLYMTMGWPAHCSQPSQRRSPNKLWPMCQTLNQLWWSQCNVIWLRGYRYRYALCLILWELGVWTSSEWAGGLFWRLWAFYNWSWSMLFFIVHVSLITSSITLVIRRGIALTWNT